ncbi:hypothetical protein AB0I49_16960 [Streptomyces sp. NPDC050617]|uniref:hypothetical protein n=1 Tax=Streptomyces sp. NPDC050617 TaxID=3154628 RepID=UPI0034143D86
MTARVQPFRRPWGGRVIRVQAVAYLPNGRAVPLGSAVVDSPRLAMRCVLNRVTDVAEQVHDAWVRRSWSQLGEAPEYERALAQLAAGCMYVFEAPDDDGAQYVVSAAPAFRSWSSQQVERPCSGASW